MHFHFPGWFLESEDDELIGDARDVMESAWEPGQSIQEWLAKFSPSQQAVFLANEFDEAVNMDGITLGYCGNRRDFMKLTPDALRRIGASRLASIAEEANEAFETAARMHPARLPGDYTEGGVVGNETLDRLDQAFFQISAGEDVRDLLIRFVRNNPGEFGG